MDPKIIIAPEIENVPKKSAGKIMLDRMKTFDANSIALFEVKTGETYTYGDLIERSVNVASNLREIFRIRKNDSVAVLSENSCKFWVVALAGLYLATPLHLLNPGYTIYELRKYFSMSKPKLVFCSKSSLEKVKTLQKDFDFIEIIISLDANISDVHNIGFYDDLISKYTEEYFEIEEDFDTEDQVAFICNSSGTTGVPKGVMITHDNFRYNFSQSQNRELYQRSHHNCIIQIIPFYHVFGFNVTSSAMYLGAKIVIMDQFQPITYLENIQIHKVDKLFIVPSLAHFLANSDLVEKYDLSSVEEVYAATGTLSDQILSSVKTKLNLKTIRQTYGLTELSSAIFMTSPTGTKPGSCGKVTPGHLVKVVDINTKQLLGPNCAGEICIKGGAMKGYLKDPEKTRETIDCDGFVHTGDVGYYDEEGDFYIIDRLRDLIKYKSFQVAPAEIEEILMQHPDIVDAAVVGKPDERFGELPTAFVVSRTGAEVDEQSVVEYVAQHLCVEKRLHGGVRFVKEVPKSSAGKILRKCLRDML